MICAPSCEAPGKADLVEAILFKHQGHNQELARSWILYWPQEGLDHNLQRRSTVKYDFVQSCATRTHAKLTDEHRSTMHLGYWTQLTSSSF